MDIEEFQVGVKKQFKIKELREKQKHLGLKYKWIIERGEKRVEILMLDLIQEIVELTKNHFGKLLRERSTPAPGLALLQDGEGEEIDRLLYRKLVGKSMSLV